MQISETIIHCWLQFGSIVLSNTAAEQRWHEPGGNMQPHETYEQWMSVLEPAD